MVASSPAELSAVPDGTSRSTVLGTLGRLVIMDIAAPWNRNVMKQWPVESSSLISRQNGLWTGLRDPAHPTARGRDHLYPELAVPGIGQCPRSLKVLRCLQWLAGRAFHGPIFNPQGDASWMSVLTM